MNGLFAQRILAATALAAAAPTTLSARAASLGYTHADSRMNRGVTLAVITLAAVAYTVLTTILLAAIYFFHKKAKARQNRPQNPVNL